MTQPPKNLRARPLSLGTIAARAYVEYGCDAQPERDDDDEQNVSRHVPIVTGILGGVQR